MGLVFGTLFDPTPQKCQVFGGQRLVSHVRWRHPQNRVWRRRASKYLAAVRVTRLDGNSTRSCGGQGCRPDVESQPGLALGCVRTMARETTVRQKRLDVPAKLHGRSDHGCNCSQSTYAEHEKKLFGARVPEHGLIPVYGCITDSGMEARTGSSPSVTGALLANRATGTRR